MEMEMEMGMGGIPGFMNFERSAFQLGDTGPKAGWMGCGRSVKE